MAASSAANLTESLSVCSWDAPALESRWKCSFFVKSNTALPALGSFWAYIFPIARWKISPSASAAAVIFGSYLFESCHLRGHIAKVEYCEYDRYLPFSFATIPVLHSCQLVFL